MPFIIRSVCALIIVIVIVFAVTNFSGPIQKEMGSVLGVKIAPKQSESLPVQIQQDVNTSIQDAAEQSKELKVEDVLGFFGQAQKIVKDYQSIQKEVEKKVSEFYEEKQDEKKD